MSTPQYRIRDKYKAVVLDSEFVLLASEKDSRLLRSSQATELLSFISQGEVSQLELLEKFSKNSPLRELLANLKHLEREGYISSSPANFPPEQMAYWEELGFNPIRLGDVFREKTLSIKAIGSLDVSAFQEAITDSGIRISSHPYLTVVVARDYLDPALEEVNREFHEQGKPWLLIRPNGTSPLIGPLFQPENQDSGCWKCLEHRLALHDKENQYYRAVKNTSEVISRPFAIHPFSAGMVAGVAGMEIASYLYHGKNTLLENGIVELDMGSGQRSHHRLTKRPQCPVCGEKDLAALPPPPIVLKAQKINPNAPGGYRTTTPEETLEKFQHHISSITGIVPYVEECETSKHGPMFNYKSGRNLALRSNSMFWLNQHLRTANGGKGKSGIQAQVGSLCESIERFSMIYPGKTYTVRGTLHSIENAIHPNECMRFSDHQIENRVATNEANSKFYSLVPVQFPESEEMEWTPVYSLTDQKFKYLPTCFCYAQYPAEDERNLYSYPDSNGCAAGNTLEEAILQGFLELIERDAAAIWWYNRIPRQGIDLEAIGDPYISTVLEYYRENGRELHVLDITTDLGIPVYASVSYNSDLEGNPEILYAFGAHLDPKIALERAVIEQNQILPSISRINGKYKIQDPVFVEWLETATLQDNEFLKPISMGLPTAPADFPDQDKGDILKALKYCLKKVESKGLETLVMDLTQPDIGLSVARVIVPGLRHFWRRTGPGRLYDVPVAMGWLDRPHREHGLNPVSIFI